MSRPLFPVLILCLLAAACAKSSAPSTPSSTPPPSAPVTPPPPPPPATTPEQAALVASLPAPYNTGDVDNGRAKFALCMACHTVQAGGPNMTGPNLHGVFGRKAGTLPGFTYSDAMKSSAHWTWDAAHLDKWLTSPATTLPGTKMTFVGLPNPQDRIDVIAYLKVASSS